MSKEVWVKNVFNREFIDIKGKTYCAEVKFQQCLQVPAAVYLGVYANRPADFDTKCHEQSWLSINQLAYENMRASDGSVDYKTYLHKAIWRCLRSCPGHIIFYVDNTVPFEDLVKFANVNGAKVSVKDVLTNTVFHIDPVYNQNNNSLFRAVPVTEDLIEERKNVMSPVYPRQNEALYAMRKHFGTLSKEVLQERAKYAEDAVLAEVISQIQAIPEFKRLSKLTDSIVQRMADELSYWASAIDLDMPWLPRESTNDQFGYGKACTRGNSYAGGDLTTIARSRKTTYTAEEEAVYKTVKANNAKVFGYRLQVLQAYTSLKYYLLHLPVEEFLRPEYILCDVCKTPVRVERVSDDAVIQLGVELPGQLCFEPVYAVLCPKCGKPHVLPEVATREKEYYGNNYSIDDESWKENILD